MNEPDYYTSQAGMEAWLRKATGPDSNIYQGNITSMLKPNFSSCDFDNKSAVISFHVEEWERNPGGTLHGGIMVAMMDTAFGMVCHYLAKQRVITTVNIATTFLKPVKIGDSVDIAVRATSIGRTLISLVCDLTIPGNNQLLAATGSATFMILSRDFSRRKP